MKSSLFSLGTFGSVIVALELTKRDNPSILRVPFKRQLHHDTNSNSQSFERRDSVSLDTGLNGNTWGYYANFTIGTPPTEHWALFDTASSDLLLLTSEVASCQKEEDKFSCFGGAVNPNDSSTWEWVDEEIDGRFASGESWYGQYAMDVLEIGGAEITDFQFAAVHKYGAKNFGTMNTFGMGLWPDQRSNEGYDSLPYALARKDYINTPAYSMWMESKEHGNFLFGAVDKSKYKGPLVTLPITANNKPTNPQLAKQTKDRDKLIVPISGLGATHKGKTTSYKELSPRPILLDTGFADSVISEDMAVWLVDNVDGLEASSDSRSLVAPCNDKVWADTTFDFSFAELTLNIPMSALVTSWNGYVDADGERWCCLNLHQPDKTYMVFGADILRHIYVVYDLANFEISLAAINKDGGKEDIHEINSKSVPGAAQATGLPKSIADNDIEDLSVADPTKTNLPLSQIQTWRDMVSASTSISESSDSSTKSSETSDAAETEDEHDNAQGFRVPVLLSFAITLSVVACTLS